MKAVIYEHYGPPQVLQLRDIKKPVPRANEILIKVVATTVTAGDWRMRKADPWMVRIFNGPYRPIRKILGMEFSGVIESAGRNITKFQIGDKVFGSGWGAYVEYKCVKEKAIVKMPESLSFEEAAAIPVGGNTALVYLRDRGKLKSGHKVLVYGASGSVGTYAVQIARAFGAQVTGVCGPLNQDLVMSLGASKVLDYTAEGLLEIDVKFDLIFDAVGKITRPQCKKLLNPEGRFVTVNKGIAWVKPENLEFLGRLATEGKLKPVIDRIYSLSQIAEAHAYVEAGHKKGNVAIRLQNP